MQNLDESNVEDRSEYSSVRSVTVSKLRELGLSSYGARAFVSILENQPISATGICKLMDIPDSKIYYALKELEDKKLVMIQHGTPATYRIFSSKNILSGLETQIQSEYDGKLKTIQKLERSLEPLVAKRTGNPADVELAYIVKGFRNIVEKMKETALEARKEIVFLATDATLVKSLEKTIKDAMERGVSLKIALGENLLQSRDFAHEIRSNKSLMCECNVMIVDSEKLVTAELRDEEQQYGIVSQNQGMITLMRKSYDNPKCCC